MKLLVLAFLVALPFSLAQANRSAAPGVNTWEVLASLTDSEQKDVTESNDLYSYSLMGKVSSAENKGESCTLLVLPKEKPTAQEAFRLVLSTAKQTEQITLKENLKSYKKPYDQNGYSTRFDVHCAEKDRCLQVDLGSWGASPVDGASANQWNLQKNQNKLVANYSRYVFDDDWGPSTKGFSCEFNLSK